MMALWQSWWRERTQREQWLLGIMAALLLGVILWLALLRPLAAARDAAAARHDAAVTALGDVQAMGAAIRVAEARIAPAVPLVELVRQRIGEAGMTASAIENSGDGMVTLRIAAVRPPAILRWIAEREAQDGVITEHISLTRNSDATVAVELSVRGGGG